MPYSYHESTHLSRENGLALKSLAATGELPTDHYWNALRTHHDANPTRFDKGNYVLAALLDRDQLQRQGTLAANAPLFSNTGFFSYAGAKHTLDMTRFDHWHPFLGRLFEITLPTTAASTTPAGEGLGGGTTPTSPISPITPVTPINPPGNEQVPPSSGTGGNGGGTTAIPQASVPEPASALMMGLALTLVLVVGGLARKAKFRPTAAQPTALA